MLSIKFKKCFFVSLFFCVLSFDFFAQTISDNKNKDFDFIDFSINPFNNREDFPQFLDSYEELKEYFPSYEFNEKEILNKYSNTIDKEISVSKEGEYFCYYLRSSDGKIFFKYMWISDFENVKHSFSKNMTKSDVTKICGNKFYVKSFEKNTNLIYEHENGELHFLFDINNKKLKEIAIISNFN